MTKVLSFAIAIALAGAAAAQQESVPPAGAEVPVSDVAAAPPDLRIADASEASLEDFLWTQRVIVVFADTPADPRFREQMDLLLSRPGELVERDVVVITDTDPDARSSVRIKLRPRGFQLALIAKDGKVNLRKPFPWDIREISRAIDKWPLRQQEIREGK